MLLDPKATSNGLLDALYYGCQIMAARTGRNELLAVDRLSSNAKRATSVARKICTLDYMSNVRLHFGAPHS
jgi:hypothetical protein